MRRDWTSIGEAIYATDAGQRAKVERAIDGLNWDTTNETFGEDWVTEVSRACRDLRLAAPRRVVFSDALAPHRLYAIESEEVNGLVRYYVMNVDGSVFVVVADFYPNEIGLRQPRWQTE